MKDIVDRMKDATNVAFGISESAADGDQKTRRLDEFDTEEMHKRMALLDGRIHELIMFTKGWENCSVVVGVLDHSGREGMVGTCTFSIDLEGIRRSATITRSLEIKAGKWKQSNQEAFEATLEHAEAFGIKSFMECLGAAAKNRMQEILAHARRDSDDA